MAIEQAGALVISDGQVLLRRHAPDLWLIPKGHVECGETAIRAAQRELREETGVEGIPRSFVGRIPFQRRGREYDLRLYTFSFVRETEEAAAHLGTDAVWLPIAEACRRLSFPQYRQALEQAIRSFSESNESSLRAATDLTSRALGRTVHLRSLSASWATRPCFRVVEEPFVVRLSRSAEEAARTEEILRLASALPVPRVVSREGAILITTWLEGVPFEEAPLPRSVLLERAGALLGSLHSLPVPGGRRARAAEDAKLYFQRILKESLEILQDTGLLLNSEARSSRERIEHSQPRTLNAAPVHWDFVPNNLIWCAGELGLIDFESARLFPAGYDLSKAFHLTSQREIEGKAFLRGYASIISLDPWRSFRDFFDGFFLIRNLANRARRPHLDLSPPLEALRCWLDSPPRLQPRRPMVPRGSVRILWDRGKEEPQLGSVEFLATEEDELGADNLLIAGDCIAALRGLREVGGVAARLAYIDPPFGKGSDLMLKVRNERNATTSQVFAFSDTWPGGFDEYLEWCSRCLSACVQLLTPDGWLFVHTGQEYGPYLRLLLDSLLGSEHFERELVWHYNWGSLTGEPLAKRHDTILVYRMSEASHATALGTEGDVWSVPVVSEEERCGFDTQKPVALLARIIERFTQEGDLVLDPCVGSGTTLVAASALRRRWLAIDRAPVALLATRKRLREAKVGFRVLRAVGSSDEHSVVHLVLFRRTDDFYCELTIPERVEYWGIDWDFKDPFIERWYSFRQRLDRRIRDVSPWLPIPRAGAVVAIRAYDCEGRESFSTAEVDGIPYRV